MAMNKTDELVIRAAIEKLRNESSASLEIRQALDEPAMRAWLDTWVVGPLEALLESHDESKGKWERGEARKLAISLSSHARRDSAYGRQCEMLEPRP